MISRPPIANAISAACCEHARSERMQSCRVSKLLSGLSRPTWLMDAREALPAHACSRKLSEIELSAIVFPFLELRSIRYRIIAPRTLCCAGSEIACCQRLFLGLVHSMGLHAGSGTANAYVQMRRSPSLQPKPGYEAPSPDRKARRRARLRAVVFGVLTIVGGSLIGEQAHRSLL